MNRTLRLRALTAAVLVVTLALAGCSGADSADPQNPDNAASAATTDEVEPGFLSVADDEFESGGELTVSLDYDTGEDAGLDPQGASTARSWMIEGLVYQTLVTVDEKMAVQPGLATKWETPSDTEYVFTLTDDATFSNGRAMTADDVTGSLQRLIDTPTVWTGQLGPIESVETTGDLEVTVTLSAPYTPFLAALANTPAGILPIAEMNDKSVDITKEMLGTGPLKVTEHRQDEFWTFEPNEHSPAAADLGFSSLRLNIVSDETTRVAGLRDSSSDIALFNSVDSADLVSGNENVSVLNQQNTDFHYLMVNSKSKKTTALADQKVRFALNSAIDRDAINNLVFADASSATGVTPAPLPDACDPADLPSGAADLGAAKQTISDAGGLELNLLVYTDEPVLSQIAQVIQQNLEEIGVTVTIENLDYATYSARVYTDGDFDLALSWFAGYADAAMVTTWWNPEIAGFSAVFMNGSEKLNTLISEGSSGKVGERKEVFDQLCQQADTESEMVPLMLRPSIIAVNTDTVSTSVYAVEGYGNFLRLITDFRAAK